MRKRILITPRSLTKNGHPALEKLKKAGFELVFSSPGRLPTEEELIFLIKGCSGYLAGVEKITKRVLESADKLKVISRNGVGTDNIDMATAKKLGIKICTTPGANSRGVAELTIGLAFEISRKLAYHNGIIKSGKWERKKGFELQNKTLGVIGCGRIGKEVIQMALSIGMKVLGCDIFKDSTFNPGKNFEYVDLDVLFAESDLITLHLPADRGGKRLISKKEIEKMKKGVSIINTARGSLIDIKDMIDALECGYVSFYAIDAYSKEPPEGIERELVQRDDVIALPHLGGYTVESIDRATEMAVNNLLKYLL